MEEVLVIIKGMREDYQNSESVEIMTMGKLYYKNNHIYILYDEEQEDMITKNTIKMNKDHVSVKRRGDIETDLYFEKDFPFITNYTTPFGHMEMCINTQQINVEDENDLIKVDIVYQLELNGMDLGVNTYSLTAKKKRSHQVKMPFEVINESSYLETNKLESRNK